MSMRAARDPILVTCAGALFKGDACTVLTSRSTFAMVYSQLFR
jgi:hypothetical protein